MRRPETAGELMQFLQAVDWLRTSLPRMAEVVYPLHVFLEEHLAGAKRRTKRVATNLAGRCRPGIGPRGWRDLGRGTGSCHAVALYHPRPGWAVLILPDASDKQWGNFLTKVPQEELDRGVSVDDIIREPLKFLSGTFKGSQQRWATVDKDGSAVVSTFKRFIDTPRPRRVY